MLGWSPGVLGSFPGKPALCQPLLRGGRATPRDGSCGTGPRKAGGLPSACGVLVSGTTASGHCSPWTLLFQGVCFSCPQGSDPKPELPFLLAVPAREPAHARGVVTPYRAGAAGRGRPKPVYPGPHSPRRCHWGQATWLTSWSGDGAAQTRARGAGKAAVAWEPTEALPHRGQGRVPLRFTLGCPRAGHSRVFMMV